MTINLKVRSGLSAPLVNAIPQQWDAQWFRRWITDFLNQQQLGAGVTSINTLVGPITLQGTANEITVTSVAGTITLLFAPNIVIPAPGSGTALTVAGGGVLVQGTGPPYPGVANSSVFLQTQQAAPGTASLGLINSTNAVDQRYWTWANVSNSLWLFATNDIDTNSHVAMQFSRSGTTLTNIQVGNATDLPSITLNGATTVTSGGLVVLGTGPTFPGVGSSNVFLQTQQAAPGTAAIGFINSSNAVDQRYWTWANVNNQIALLATNDADTSSHVAEVFSRSGTTITNITLGNATDTPSITLTGATTVSTGGLVALGTGPTFPGVTNSSVFLQIQQAAPGTAAIGFINANGAANTKYWTWATSGAQMTLFATNDASTTSHVAMTFTRSGTTITAVAIGNATDLPTITLNGPTTVTQPTAGTALTVNGLSANDTLELLSTGAAGPLAFGWAAGISGGQWNIWSRSTDPITLGTQGAAALEFATNNASRMTISSAGLALINAPAANAGATLQLNSANTAASPATLLIGLNTAAAPQQVAALNATNSVDADFQILVTPQGAGVKAATLSPSVNVPLRFGGYSSNTTAGIQCFGPVAAAYNDMTYDTTTVTATCTGGMTTTPSGTMTLYRVGKMVMANVASITGTGNNAHTVLTFGVGAWPTGFAPVTSFKANAVGVENNGIEVICSCFIFAGATPGFEFVQIPATLFNGACGLTTPTQLYWTVD